MRYRFLLGRLEDRLPDPGTPDAAELFEAYREANEAMAAAGVLVDCAPLDRARRRRPCGCETARRSSPTAPPRTLRNTWAATPSWSAPISTRP